MKMINYERAKAYLSLLLAALGFFLLGAYTFGTVYNVKEVSTLQWVITPFFTLYFLSLFIVNISKKSK